MGARATLVFYRQLENMAGVAPQSGISILISEPGKLLCFFANPEAQKASISVLFQQSKKIQYFSVLGPMVVLRWGNANLVFYQ